MTIPVYGTLTELARLQGTLPSTLKTRVEKEGVKPVARLKSGGRVFDLFPIPAGTVNPRHLVGVPTE